MKDNYLKIIVFAPCFNESQKLPVLLKKIWKVRSKLLKKNAKIIKLLLIDDASTDNSALVLKKLSKKYAFLKVKTHERNNGGAKTVLEGYAESLKISKKTASNTLIVRMDSDLEHPPEDIPRIVELYKKGFETIIGQIQFSKSVGPFYYAFNRMAGKIEGGKILGQPFAHFCPGMIAIKTSVLEELWLPLLKEKNAYMQQYKEFPVTLDLFLIAMAKKLGKKIKVITVGKKIKKLSKQPTREKIGGYEKMHEKTMQFFKKRNLIKI